MPTGGTQTEGGKGGSGNSQSNSPCSAEEAGIKFRGGRGRGWNNCDVGYGSGGGGGGGWYGGGGGSGGQRSTDAHSGAGGSSYINHAYMDATSPTACYPGNGQEAAKGYSGSAAGGDSPGHGGTGHTNRRYGPDSAKGQPGRVVIMWP